MGLCMRLWAEINVIKYEQEYDISCVIEILLSNSTHGDDDDNDTRSVGS